MASNPSKPGIIEPSKRNAFVFPVFKSSSYDNNSSTLNSAIGDPYISPNLGLSILGKKDSSAIDLNGLSVSPIFSLISYTGFLSGTAISQFSDHNSMAQVRENLTKLATFNSMFEQKVIESYFPKN